MTFDALLIHSDPDDIDRERRKARTLKQSVWWKNRRGEGRCYYCGQQVHPRELTMDHMIPLVRGGRTTRGNCVPACKACNDMKKNLPPEEWKARLEVMQTE